MKVGNVRKRSKFWYRKVSRNEVNGERKGYVIEYPINAM